MCGIYGYLSPTGTIDPTILRRMGHPLKHRGPDDEGEVILDSSEVSVGLGHKRLSIIDLSPAGKQPMANEDETIWITFNGEIYNFREIRKELEGKGHKFRSHSDTEVIVHLYEELGTKCLERLNGMFAFALWDAKQKSLFLARDRTGKKPLHYCVHRGHFLFASEIKALLQHPLVSREIDLKSLNKYLAYEYVPAPNSIFKAIKKLEPGYCLLFRGGAAVTSQYWDIPMEDYPISDRTEAQYIDELKELLERAVTARLEAADVPVGLFVSGGLDSGVLPRWREERKKICNVSASALRKRPSTKADMRSRSRAPWESNITSRSFARRKCCTWWNGCRKSSMSRWRILLFCRSICSLNLLRST